MAYVITEPCISVKDRACVEVYSADCIHSDESQAQMFINPNECLVCGACEVEFPISAIFEDTQVPAKWRHHIELNAAYFG